MSLAIGKDVRRTIIKATLLYILDGWIMGMGGVFSFLVVAGLLFWTALKSLASLLNRQPLPKTLWAKVGVYALCFTAALLTERLDQQVARNRAERVVAAVKQYKAKYGEYPSRLQALVPEFIPEVPNPKFTFPSFPFNYERYDYQGIHGATLRYVVVAPYGRAYFKFEQDRWGYLD